MTIQLKPGLYTGNNLRKYSGRHTLFEFKGKMHSPDIASLTLINILITEEEYNKIRNNGSVFYEEYLEDIRYKRTIRIRVDNLIPFYTTLSKEAPL